MMKNVLYTEQFYIEFVQYIEHLNSKTETDGVFGWLFPFWKIARTVILYFRTTDCFKNENSLVAIAKFATTEENRNFRFFYIMIHHEYAAAVPWLLHFWGIVKW